MLDRRVQRLGFAFGGVLLITLLWVRLFPTQGLPDPVRAGDQILGATQEVSETDPGSHPEIAPSPLPSDTVSEPIATPPPRPGSGATSVGADLDHLRTYAVGLYELRGLPPDASPGSELELWAALEPPHVKAPRFFRFDAEVILEKIVPGLTPESPSTALLLVSADRLSDLLYFDRYGELSVAMLRG